MVRRIYIAIVIGLFALTVAECAHGDSDAASLLKQADMLYQNRQYDQAEQIYLSIAKQNVPEAFTAQKSLTILYVTTNKALQADAAYKELLTRFVGHKDMPQAIYEIARAYRGLKNTPKANELYQYCIQQWHESEYAIHSQRDMIHINIEAADEKAAQAGIDDLLTDFGKHKDIAGTIYNLAKYYNSSVKNPQTARQLHQYNIDKYPKEQYAIWSQVEIIKSHIRDANDGAVDAAFGKFVSIFAAQKTLPREIYQVGLAYSKAGRQDRAKLFYQYGIEHWPQDEYAIRSQLAILDSQAVPDKDATVDALFDNLVAVLSEQKTPAKDIYEIAMRYTESRPDNARRVHQFNAESSSKEDIYAMWSQTEIIKSYIRSGDDTAADAGYAKLLAMFSQHPTLAKELYQVADAYYSTADRYDRGSNLFGYVLQNYPETEWAVMSRAALCGISIRRGDKVDPQTIVDGLVSVSNGYPILPEAVFKVGQGFYTKATSIGRGGKWDQAAEDYRKAIAVWERLIRDFPSSEMVPRAYWCSAVVYSQELREYQKGIDYYQQIVDTWADYKYAWHAQYLIGFYYEKLKQSKSVPESQAVAKIEQAYKAVLEKYPESESAPQAVLRLGKLYLDSGRWADAGSYLEMFVQMDNGRIPNHVFADALRDLGRVYEQMGKVNMAIEMYRRFIEISDQGDSRVRAVRARLDMLEGEDK